MAEKRALRRLWESFLEAFTTTEPLFPQEILDDIQEAKRSIGMGRLREQLWDALEDSEGGWAFPIDIYLGDDGSSLFSIVAQNGKLFQVPITVQSDTISLGDWVQVTEDYRPVEQATLRVVRQKDGTARWVVVAATSVLNRVSEIDSTVLYDSFVARAEKHDVYPRLDFYHMGRSDPELWDFGIADYVGRDGVCYVVSGTFFEDHPLAVAFQRASQDKDKEWGCSIEFYAIGEPETIVVDPEVQVPVYMDGLNTRVSVVLEEDAASLFTRSNVIQEKTRVNKKMKDALRTLFGEDEEAFEAFVEEVDDINRTVDEEDLIYRKKGKGEEQESAEEEAVPEDADEAAEEDAPTPTEVVLEEEDLEAIGRHLLDSDYFKNLFEPSQRAVRELEEIKATFEEQVDELVKGIEDLAKENKALRKRVGELEKDEDEKRTEWQQDLPSRRQMKVHYRPRFKGSEDEDDQEEETMADLAERTLSSLPSY